MLKTYCMKGVLTMEEMLEFLHEQKLNNWIVAFRDILNEMICCTIDDIEQSIEILIVSRHLDELIAEYMSIKKQIYS